MDLMGWDASRVVLIIGILITLIGVMLVEFSVPDPRGNGNTIFVRVIGVTMVAFGLLMGVFSYFFY